MIINSKILIILAIIAIYLQESFCLCILNGKQLSRVSLLRRPCPNYNALRKMAIIEEIIDDSSEEGEDLRTDEDKGLTHGYEGNFKVGDSVKVITSMKIYSVKSYSKEGFDPIGMTGTVAALVLYGRKKKSLCSAITPIKVEFQPNGSGIPEGMFDKKWNAHFCAEELELLESDKV